MPNMHVSVFIRPTDKIASTGLSLDRSFTVGVRLYPGDGGAPAEISLFADSLSQLADFGRAIVAECEKLMPDSADASDSLLASAPLIEIEGDGLDTVKIPAFDFANNVCAECGKQSTHIYGKIFLCKEHFDELPF